MNTNSCISCKNKHRLLQSYDSWCLDCVKNSKYEFQEFVPHKIVNKERERQYLMAAMKITKNNIKPYINKQFTVLPDKVLIGDNSITMGVLFLENYNDFEGEFIKWIKKYYPEKYKLIFGGK